MLIAVSSIEAVCGHKVALEIEPGRYLVAESGFLVSRVRGAKMVGPNKFLICDAGFSDLVRPAFYGAYHHITGVSASGAVLPAEPSVPTVVAGPLCESGDVFTQAEGGVVVPRALPAALDEGCYVVLHTAGAYGSTMSSNYNSRRYCAELLLDRDGGVHVVRERQSLEALVQFDRVPPHLA